MQGAKGRYRKGDVLVLNPYDPKGYPVKEEDLIFAEIRSYEEDHYVVGITYQPEPIEIKDTSSARLATPKELEIFEEKNAILYLGILRDS